MVESSSKLKDKVKVVFVGDGAVGKTCLVTAYGENGFPQKYIPTVAKNFENKCEYDGRTVTLDIWDTGGQKEFKAVRPLSYNGADAIVVCFSLVEPLSLVNACDEWLTEIQNSAPRNVAKILCGTKQDVREEGNSQHVSWDMGNAKADEHKFLSYVECSALLFDNCDTVFSEAVRTAILLDSNRPRPGGAPTGDNQGQKQQTCFLKSQTVQRLDQQTGKAATILIDDVKMEDKLLSWSSKTGQTFWDPVIILQHHVDKEYPNDALKITLKNGSSLSLASGHMVLINKNGTMSKIPASKVEVGDKMIYIPKNSAGTRLANIVEVSAIEAFVAKTSEFIELHTSSYTVVVEDILAHCSSQNDKAVLRPLEQVFGKICPKAMNQVYGAVQGTIAEIKD